MSQPQVLTDAAGNPIGQPERPKAHPVRNTLNPLELIQGIAKILEGHFAVHGWQIAVAAWPIDQPSKVALSTTAGPVEAAQAFHALSELAKANSVPQVVGLADPSVAAQLIKNAGRAGG